MRKQIVHFALCIMSLFFFSCANQVAPTGGEKDVKPPHITQCAPKNYSTSFRQNDFNISFDEFIQLKDISTQLVVSPPLKYPLVTRIKNKTLFVHLDDTLRQNVTYTVNFGNALTDNTESNVLENFQYVFSTGEIIDTLRVSGKVEFAFNKKTEKGISVMLYQSLNDSVALKDLPNYFAKTNESGEFSINNVSPGNYQLVALKDENSNYLFENGSEAVAVSEKVEANQSGLLLRLFKEKPKQQLMKAYCEESGKVVIVYSRPLENSSVIFLSDTSALKLFSDFYSAKKDTLTVWYRNRQNDSLNMIVQYQNGSDTISVRLRHPDEKAKQVVVAGIKSNFVSGEEVVIEPTHLPEIIFNRPIEKFDFSKLILIEDSLQVNSAAFSFGDEIKTKLLVNLKVKENKKYSLLIPPVTLTDIFGNKNDTLKYFFRAKQLTDFGTLTLKLKFPSQEKNYLLQLVDDNENIYKQNPVSGDTVLRYTFLNPQSYRIKLIEDANSNGEWDSGNFLKHIEPEHVFYYSENITIRANWDVDVNWKPEVEK